MTPKLLLIDSCARDIAAYSCAEDGFITKPKTNFAEVRPNEGIPSHPLCRFSHCLHCRDLHFIYFTRQYLGIHGASFMKSSSALALKAWNESLGFGDVLSSGRDEPTGVHERNQVKLIEVIDGDSINLKAIPDNADPNLRALNWDAWRFVIENNLDTALILEDDIDWDEDIHEIFQDLSIQMQNSTLRLDSPSDQEQASAPYGLDWDVLVMGQCVDKAHPEHHDLVLVYDDPNVPSRDDTEFVFLKVMKSLGVSGDDVGKKRLLYPAFGPA
ncbi:hypothetical protein V1520DRAFT_329917, partial [Lipomyces starkeyi]